MTKRENAPSIVVHLFEVRLLRNSQLLMASLVLKHIVSSYFSLFLPLFAGRWNLTISLACCGRWIKHPVADTNTNCLPSQAAHLTETQSECAYVGTVCFSSTHFAMATQRWHTT